MRYENIYPAQFIDRPNRFVAHVSLDGEPQVCHVKNTGRCKELLTPGAQVYIQKSQNPSRKTPYDLIAVFKPDKSAAQNPASAATNPTGRLINMDSQAPNKVAEEWIRAGGLGSLPTLVKPECRYGSSRFDFYVELPGEADAETASGTIPSPAAPLRLFMEVKGVTLEEDGVCLFPDAPTERGLKHIAELEACLAEGYEAAILFVIQMKDVRCFTPNRRTQPAFADALMRARKAGVKILAYDCQVTPEALVLRSPVEVKLPQ